MAKQDAIELEGTVTEVLPNATFRVVTKSGHEVLSTLAGNMRRFRIRVRRELADDSPPSSCGCGESGRVYHGVRGLAVSRAISAATPGLLRTRR